MYLTWVGIEGYQALEGEGQIGERCGGRALPPTSDYLGSDHLIIWDLIIWLLMRAIRTRPGVRWQSAISFPLTESGSTDGKAHHAEIVLNFLIRRWGSVLKSCAQLLDPQVGGRAQVTCSTSGSTRGVGGGRQQLAAVTLASHRWGQRKYSRRKRSRTKSCRFKFTLARRVLVIACLLGGR